MKKLILLCGIPGSGKTTLAAKLAEQGFICLSADDIRQELWGDAAEQKEAEKVFEIFFDRLQQGLSRGWNIVIDNTNINTRHREPILQQAKKAGYKDIELWVFDIPLPVCIERNKQRGRIVPEEIITNMYTTLHGSGKPEKREGRIKYVRPAQQPFEVQFFAK